MVNLISDGEICPEEYGDEGTLSHPLRIHGDENSFFAQVLYFHIVAHSFARTNSTLLFSSASALFAQKHRGWGVPSSSQVTHICYSGKPTMIASSPLLPQNAARKRNLTP